MTTRNVYWASLRLLLFVGIALVVKKAWGAEELPPIVHILATDPCAAEQEQDTATFTVFRTGPTNAPLTIRYAVAGTAGNGVDYAGLSGEVTIPACASSASVTITPVDDTLVEGGETVAMFLTQPVLWPPPYIVCWPNFAVGHIEDNDLPPTNRPPVVRLTNPPDESVFLAPVDIRLMAHATDFDGRVRSVEFFDGTNSLGIASNRPPIVRPLPIGDDVLDLTVESDPLAYPDLSTDANIDPSIIPASVFSLNWRDVSPGPHVLIAVATDNLSAASRSEPIQIRVIDPPSQAIVNVKATDPSAAEPDPAADRLNTATFTVHRSGSTDFPMPVYYRIGGTALNGVDYRELPHSVIIPRGSSEAEVIVAPLDDELVEGPESVVIRIEPPVCPAIFPPPPECYLVGRADEARAIIHDNDIAPSNRPPVVEIVRPLDGSVFLAPADVRIAAQARDHDGRVVSVEFFEGTNSLGIVSNTPSLLNLNTPPFMLAWNSVPPGSYVLHALATDNEGAQARSRPVEIKVADREPPAVVNIIATDAEAAETPAGATPNPARFQISRTGSTANPLVVFYSVGGSALNGIDYREIPGRVVLPMGAAAAPLVIEPVDDRLVEGTETVVLTLEPPICLAIFPPPGDCYVVGPSNSARAVIQDNDTSLSNEPPKIAIMRPASGDIFETPADIAIVAEARDADGFVRMVEFFEGTNRLCVVSNSLELLANLPLGYEPSFRCAWQNVPPGAYELRARATDNRGVASWSEPVRIKVVEDHALPVVTIAATDPHAAEEDWTYYPVRPEDFIGPPSPLRPDIAVFTITRDRGTDVDLTVHFRLGGTATNGLDYLTIVDSVVIPRGSRHATIVVLPIDDALVEGTETVIASLDPVGCIAVFPPPPDCYLVGEPARAVAYIRDNDFENRPPKVEIVEPANEQNFHAGADIEIVAAVRDLDGYVSEVEFFEGTNSIGRESRVYIIAPPPGELHKFSIVWSNVPPGRYELTAKATDSEGAMSRSEPVKIVVGEPCRVPAVTVRATDSSAREQSPLLDSLPDTATFRVTRTCETNSGLHVRYSVGGTASNGIDYRRLDGVVFIPPGAESADIVVDPIDDDLVEGVETVELTLVEGNCLSLGLNICYTVGTPGKAVAFIHDNENRPPRIVIVSPENGYHFREGADIPIVAQTVDPDGWVQRVEFFADGRSIGVQVINFLVEPPPGQVQRFSLTWSDAPAGRHVLTAEATDSQGAMTTSGPVIIEVAANPPPPTVCIAAVDALAREGTPPNTAAFRIRRSGGTNEPLTVHYAIRGTASNGVDYVMIPSATTIPAGRRGVRVVITPVDDRRAEPIETVVLRLEQAALYNVGFPDRAGAIIVDNDRERPGPCRLSDGNFHARIDHADARYYRVEWSRDLLEWRPICTNLVGDDGIHFVDPDAAEEGKGFYRSVAVPEEEFFDEE